MEDIYEAAHLIEKRIENLEEQFRREAEEADRNHNDYFSDQHEFVESRYRPTCWRCGQIGH